MLNSWFSTTQASRHVKTACQEGVGVVLLIELVHTEHITQSMKTDTYGYTFTSPRFS